MINTIKTYLIVYVSTSNSLMKQIQKLNSKNIRQHKSQLKHKIEEKTCKNLRCDAQTTNRRNNPTEDAESDLSRLDSVLLLDQIGDLINWASVSIIQAVAESSQRHMKTRDAAAGYNRYLHLQHVKAFFWIMTLTCDNFVLKLGDFFLFLVWSWDKFKGKKIRFSRYLTTL